jgi:hypothetical protein
MECRLGLGWGSVYKRTRFNNYQSVEVRVEVRVEVTDSQLQLELQLDQRPRSVRELEGESLSDEETTETCENCDCEPDKNKETAVKFKLTCFMSHRDTALPFRPSAASRQPAATPSYPCPRT